MPLSASSAGCCCFMTPCMPWESNALEHGPTSFPFDTYCCHPLLLSPASVLEHLLAKKLVSKPLSINQSSVAVSLPNPFCSQPPLSLDIFLLCKVYPGPKDVESTSSLMHSHAARQLQSSVGISTIHTPSEMLPCSEQASLLGVGPPWCLAHDTA